MKTTEQDVKQAFITILKYFVEKNETLLAQGKPPMTLLDSVMTDPNGKEIRLITHMSFYGKEGIK